MFTRFDTEKVPMSSCKLPLGSQMTTVYYSGGLDASLVRLVVSPVVACQKLDFVVQQSDW